MFYGREEQLARFEALWHKRVPSFVVCRGRRRIGKSTLVQEFARRSGGSFLKLEGLAPDEHMTNAKQLTAFREQLAFLSKDPVPRLQSWTAAWQALDAVLKTVEGRKIVLLDEVSWMGGYDKTFPAKLKIAWDNLFSRHSDLIVFVCGSVSTWIHKNILMSKGFVGRISLDSVVTELPLSECIKFWGTRAKRLDVKEILDVLSVTGGVPRYLEEVDPTLSADENIRRICFTPDGYLFREFNELFSDIISRTAPTKRRVLEALSEGPMSGTELAERLSIQRSGRMSDLLDELETAGFIVKADGLNPATGRRARVDQYRLRDNYTRFFLKYVAPRLPEIESGAFSFAALSLLPAWETMMGLQFENLILNNLPAVLVELGFAGRPVLSAAPYRCVRSDRGGGVQVDLLVQTASVATIVEIKRRNGLGVEVVTELRQKVARLPVRKGVSVRTALVYAGRVSVGLQASDGIDRFVPVERLLDGCGRQSNECQSNNGYRSNEY